MEAFNKYTEFSSTIYQMPSIINIAISFIVVEYMKEIIKRLDIQKYLGKKIILNIQDGFGFTCLNSQLPFAFLTYNDFSYLQTNGFRLFSLLLFPYLYTNTMLHNSIQFSNNILRFHTAGSSLSFFLFKLSYALLNIYPFT